MLHELDFAHHLAPLSVLPLLPCLSLVSLLGCRRRVWTVSPEPRQQHQQQRSYRCSRLLGRDGGACPALAVQWGPALSRPIPASPSLHPLLPQVPSPSLRSGRHDFIFDLRMSVEMTHLIIHIHTHIPALCIYKGISFILIHESNLSSDADLANSVVAEMFPSCCPCPGL